ncbi:hypothetical protein [Streptomyces sp. NPDC047315]|uniref:hypothetical protein n=1 Tax=Streptomyces sp. NPDC047315 TaxID=3155142 RepID=UPI0033FD4A5F
MTTFLDDRREPRRIAELLADYGRRLNALERETQAAHTSIEGGALDIYDEEGNLRGSVGVQPDGGVALVPVGTAAPPTPTAPTVEPVLAGLLIGWDGQWDDSYTTPSDFSLIQVHVGPSVDFTPTVATLAATITARLGGTVTVAVDGYAAVYVRLVAANTAAIAGPASAATSGVPRQAVGQDLIDGIVTETKLAASAVTAAKIALGAVGPTAITDGAITTPKILAGAITAEKIVGLAVTAEKIAALAVTTDKLSALSVTADKLAVNSVTASKIAAGIIDATHIKAGSLSADRLALGTDGNVIADPSFEGAGSDQRVAGSSYWSIAAPGNGTARALQVNAVNGTAVTRSMTLATLPAVPGQKVWLTLDYLASADWNGVRISFYAQWLDAAGAILGYSTITTGDNLAVRGTWTTLSGAPTAAAPTGTVQLRVACSTVNSSAGTVQYDNTSCRIVTASGIAGARAELSPVGLMLYDDAGDEAVSLVTGRPNYLTLSTDGVPVATIDQEGGAHFQTLTVADSLSVGGTALAGHLNELPRGLLAIGYQSSSVSNAAGADMGFVELGFVAEVGRMYRTVFDCYASPSLAGGEVQLTLRDGGASAPLISSTQVQSAIYPMPGAGALRVRLEDVRSGERWGAGQHRMLLTFKNAGGPSGQTVRLFGGASHRGALYVEDIGPVVPETGAYNTGGGATTPPVQKYTRTYAAAWSGSYANRGSYNSHFGNRCFQGYYSSTNGTQAAMIGFPAALGTDLSGATILKAEVYLYFEHWHANAGGRAVIKAHRATSRPATFAADSESQSISWKRNEGKWVDITPVFDSTSWRGIALDPNSTSSTYYGIARGVGQTNPPQLRVTYTK